MARLALRFGIALGLIGCLDYGFGQQPSPTDPLAYESLLRRVAELVNRAGAITMNGEPTALTQPSPQQAIGLTDQEAQILNTESSDCEAELTSLSVAVGPLIFESRLRVIESGTTSDWLAERLKMLDKQHEQIVLTHIQRLKAAFGEDRFQMLDAFVRARKDKNSFFPASGVFPVRVKK